MKAQRQNTQNVDLLATFFLRRNESNVAWGNAVSIHLLLPELRGFWPGSVTDVASDWAKPPSRVMDISGAGRHLECLQGVAVGVEGLAPVIYFDAASFQYLRGPVRQPRYAYNVIFLADSPYTLTPEDELLFVDTNGGDVTINVPVPAGSVYDRSTYRWEFLNVGPNNIILTPPMGITVNGGPTYTVPTGYHSARLYSDNINYFVPQ